MSLYNLMVAVVTCTVCLFGFSCHWHRADLLSSDPVELSKVFFMLVA